MLNLFLPAYFLCKSPHYCKGSCRKEAVELKVDFSWYQILIQALPGHVPTVNHTVRFLHYLHVRELGTHRHASGFTSTLVLSFPSSHIFSEARPHHCIPVDLLWQLCLSSHIASINRKVQSHRPPKVKAAFWLDFSSINYLTSPGSLYLPLGLVLNSEF